jgi:hypothetical protein
MNMALPERARSGGALREIGGLAHVELDLAWQLDDGLGMLSVFEQRIFDGLGTADEQAAIEAVLLQRDPLAATVPANEDDGGRRAARGRFDEFHFRIPSDRYRRQHLPHLHTLNILSCGYDFEDVSAAIS